MLKSLLIQFIMSSPALLLLFLAGAPNSIQLIMGFITCAVRELQVKLYKYRHLEV